MGSAQGLGPAKSGKAEPRLTPGQSVPGFPPAEISPVSGNVRSAMLGHLPRIATATFLIAIAPPSSVGPIARWGWSKGGQVPCLPSDSKRNHRIARCPPTQANY